MCARIEKSLLYLLRLCGKLRLGKCLHFIEMKSHLIASLDYSDAPCGSVQTFLYVADRIAYLDDVGHRINAQLFGIAVHHPRQRTACGKSVGSKEAVGRIAERLCLGNDNSHHFICISRSRTDLQSHLTEPCDSLNNIGIGFAVLFEYLQQRRNVLCIKPVHIVICRFAALYLCPFGTDPRFIQQYADMLYLQHAHRLSRFLDSDINALAAENIKKYFKRSKASEINGGSCPVKYNSFYLFHKNTTFSEYYLSNE